MPQPLVAGLPPWLELEAGSVIRLTALDPTTGAEVTGVELSDVSFFVRNIGADAGTGGGGSGEYVGPLLVPSSDA